MPHHNHLRRHPADAGSPQAQAQARARAQAQAEAQFQAHAHAHASRHAAQFQTPPTRDIPQLHPSPAPTYTPAQSVGPAHPTAAAQAAIYSLFGRGGGGRGGGGGTWGRQRPQMMDEDEGEGEDVGEESEGFADDTFAQEEGPSLDPDGNEVTLSDEDAAEAAAAGMVDAEDEEEEEEEEHGMNGGEDEEEEEDEMMREERSPSPLPSNLREISSLASWTVSTHKPGCGVAALRNPSPIHYWQSDGPQPHTLSLHFFKLVAVVRIRVYLDFEVDESYTPTKMVFLAGMGGNDLVEFATWEGEGPCGWVNIPLEGVGGRSGGWVRKKKRRRTRAGHHHHHHNRRASASAPQAPADANSYIFSDSDAPLDYDEGAYEDDNDETADEDDEDDPYAGSVLKAMVIQMRIIENHQNGKDTHVRGFQVFARDDDRRRLGTAPSASAEGRARRTSVQKPMGKDGEDDENRVIGLEEPDWMGEPVIR